MSKSRAGKTKAAGAAVGMDKYKRFYGGINKLQSGVKPNRMIRRMQGK